MNNTFSAIIKTALSVLLFLCLLKMPYGYYQIVRFAALVGFSLLTVDAIQKKRIVEAILFAFLVLLFQPFLKVALGKEVWNVTDVVVGVGLIISLFVDQIVSKMNQPNQGEGNSNDKSETKKKKTIAIEVLIFFSTVAVIGLIWGGLELRTSYYRKQLEKRDPLAEKITSLYQDIYFMAPSGMETYLLEGDEKIFTTNMRVVDKRLELYTKLNRGYVKVASDGGRSKPYAYDFLLGDWESFNLRIENAIKEYDTVEYLKSHVVYSDKILVIIGKIALVFFIVLYPIRFIVKLILWSIKTLKT